MSLKAPPARTHCLNRGESVVRALFLSTTGLPVDVDYPDTGQWLMQNGRRPDETVLLEPADRSDGP